MKVMMAMLSSAAFVVSLASALATSSSSSSSSSLPTLQQSQSQQQPPLFSLQDAHAPRSPTEVLRELASACCNTDTNSKPSDVNEHGLDSSIIHWDVYGDFDKNNYASSSSSSSSSFLRRFEAEISNEFGFDDAVFMPSGVMAQSIALLIHAQQRRRRDSAPSSDSNIGTTTAPTTKGNNEVVHFICHDSSHLLLHEQDAYRELLNMNAIVVSTTKKATRNQNDIPIVPPMRFADVQERMKEWHLEQTQQQQRQHDTAADESSLVAALILEVPHRELGGKMTSWQDMDQMRDYCHDNGIAFHCDGARIFEATTAYDNNDNNSDNNVSARSPRENLVAVAKLFDSMYISFYKGLGGMSGAMLMGTSDFCQEARVWLRRFGGNLYTLLPYYVSAWLGYQRQWKLHSSSSSWSSSPNIPTLALSFAQKKQKLVRLVAALSADPNIKRIISFDPPIPETNMVHGYVHQPLLLSSSELNHDSDGDIDSSLSAETCRAICNAIQEETGIRVLTRMREVNISTAVTTTTTTTNSSNYDGSKHDVPHHPKHRVCCKFEWAMGEANGNIPDEIYMQGWSRLAKAILKRNE